MFKPLLLAFALALSTQAFPLPRAFEPAQQGINNAHPIPNPVPSSVLPDTDILLNNALQTIQQEIEDFLNKYSVPDLLPVLGEPGIVIPSAINPPRPAMPIINPFRNEGDDSIVH